ncbi:metallothionein-I gene transcription activator [Histoplasma ohiense]
MNFSKLLSALPLSIAHRARRIPSFQRPPPGPTSFITSPLSPGPILLVSASQMPDITKRAATFMSTNSKMGWSRGISLRSILMSITAFSLGILPPPTSESGRVENPKSEG